MDSHSTQCEAGALRMDRLHVRQLLALDHSIRLLPKGDNGRISHESNASA